MKHFLTLTLLASAMAWGQDAPKLNARELFYAVAPTPPASPAATPQPATSSTRPPASTTASTNTNKKQTTAKNTTGSGRPATGNTSGSGNGAANTQTTAQNSPTGTSTPATGNPPAVNPPTGTSNPIEIGQPSTGQGHVINASATTGPLGLRYAVLKRDTSGAFHEIDPDTTFRTGDAIRLQVEANTSGYLYVVTQGTSGQWQLLFPRPDVAGGSDRVEPHVQVQVPSNKGVWKFDEHAGTEKLFVVLARQPEPDLDKLIYAISGTGGGNGGGATLLAQASIRDDVVTHLREKMLSRDLVFEKVDDSTSDSAPVKNENAAYVVTVSTAPDARVVKDFALQHR